MRTVTLTCLAAALTVPSCPATAAAESITYFTNATASGSLNGVRFREAELSLAGTADTATVQQNTSVQPDFLMTYLTVTGEISGVGTFTLPGIVFRSSRYGAAGFSGAVVMGDILDTFSPSLSAWDMVSDLAATAGSGNSLLNPGLGFSTDRGTLVLTSARTVAFSASVSYGSAATPEPWTLTLLSTGMIGVAIQLKRRR